MITIWPLDNTDYTAEAIGAFSGTRTRGVFSANNNLACTPTGGRTVTISPGLAWLKKSDFWGVALLNTETITFELAVASGTLSRFVAVVARLDKDANKPEIILRYGDLSTKAVLPSLTRDSHADELFLCSISQRAGSVEITAADITDLRTDEVYCGIMRDGVTGIPTAQLQNQAYALIEQLNAAIQACISGGLPNGSVTTATFNPSAIAPNAAYATRAGNADNATNSQHSIQSDNAAKLNGQQAGYYLQSSNLLDNSNFITPVNQRGIAFNTAITATGYFIDRWKLITGSVKLTDNGLQLTSGTKIAQILEYAAGTSTISRVGIYSGSSNQAYDNLSKTFTLTAVGTCVVQWAKLEKGSIATPYVAKDYSAELNECMRYYQSVIYTQNMPANGTVAMGFALPITMRIAPTYTIKDYAENVGYWGAWGVNKAFTVSAISLYNTGCRWVTIAAGTTPIPTTPFYVAGTVLLSADL